jgi:hypothetical protein
VHARLSEPAAERGDIAGRKMLVTEYRHPMLGKHLFDQAKVASSRAAMSTPTASMPSVSPSGRSGGETAVEILRKGVA